MLEAAILNYTDALYRMARIDGAGATRSHAVTTENLE